MKVWKTSADKDYKSKITVAVALNTEVATKAIAEASVTAAASSDANLGFSSTFNLSIKSGKHWNLFNFAYSSTLGYKNVENKKFVKEESKDGDLKYTNILANYTNAKGIAFIAGGWGVDHGALVKSGGGDIECDFQKEVQIFSDNKCTFVGNNSSVAYIEQDASHQSETFFVKEGGKIDLVGQSSKISLENTKIELEKGSKITLDNNGCKLNLLQIKADSIAIGNKTKIGNEKLEIGSGNHVITEAMVRAGKLKFK